MNEVDRPQPDNEKLDWYRRRVAVLEVLVASYRLGKVWISEAVHRELEATGERIDSKGEWRQGP